SRYGAGGHGRNCGTGTVVVVATLETVVVVLVVIVTSAVVVAGPAPPEQAATATESTVRMRERRMGAPLIVRATSAEGAEEAVAGADVDRPLPQHRRRLQARVRPAGGPQQGRAGGVVERVGA